MINDQGSAICSIPLQIEGHSLIFQTGWLQSYTPELESLESLDSLELSAFFFLAGGFTVVLLAGVTLGLAGSSSSEDEDDEDSLELAGRFAPVFFVSFLEHRGKESN